MAFLHQNHAQESQTEPAPKLKMYLVTIHDGDKDHFMSSLRAATAHSGVKVGNRIECIVPMRTTIKFLVHVSDEEATSVALMCSGTYKHWPTGKSKDLLERFMAEQMAEDES